MPNWCRYNKDVLEDHDNYFKGVLRAARVSSGLTQKELGVLLHLNMKTINHIENGKTIGYTRYLPKVLAWLRACNCKLVITIIPVVDPLLTERPRRARASMPEEFK